MENQIIKLRKTLWIAIGVFSIIIIILFFDISSLHSQLDPLVIEKMNAEFRKPIDTAIKALSNVDTNKKSQ